MIKKSPLKDLPIDSTHEKLIKDFEQYLKVSGYRIAKRSSSIVRELLWWVEKEELNLKEITSENVKKYYEYLQHRPNYSRSGNLSFYTIDGYLFILKLFFNYVQKIGLKAKNPMSVLSFDHWKRGVKKERKVLTKLEIKELYNACENEFEKVILGLFYGCGLRRSEVEKLNRKDLDVSKNGLKCLYVRSGKGRKRRVVPMAENVINDLKNYLSKERVQRISRHTKPTDKKALLLNKIGTRMTGNILYRNFKTILLRTGIKKEISLHHLRHAIATHLLEEGMRVEEVRDFLGHECLESTQIYTRVSQEQLKM